jgi:hypothetical protein
MASPVTPGDVPGKEVAVALGRQIDDDRAVVHVDLPGGIRLMALWVIGLAGSHPEPMVSWPRTARGFPILTVPPEMKERIDAAVLEAVSA